MADSSVCGGTRFRLLLGENGDSESIIRTKAFEGGVLALPGRGTSHHEVESCHGSQAVWFKTSKWASINRRVGIPMIPSNICRSTFLPVTSEFTRERQAHLQWERMKNSEMTVIVVEKMKPSSLRYSHFYSRGPPRPTPANCGRNSPGAPSFLPPSSRRR